MVRDAEHGERFARMKVPGVLPRLVPCDIGTPSADESVHCFVWLEQVISANLDVLFPGLEVLDSFPFRVTRNADIEIQEDEASDLLRTIEEGLRQRQFGAVARLEINPRVPALLRDLLASNLLVDTKDVYELAGSLGLSAIMALMKIDRPDLKDPVFTSHVPPNIATAKSRMITRPSCSPKLHGETFCFTTHTIPFALSLASFAARRTTRMCSR